MPQRNLESRRTFLRLFLFLLFGGALITLTRRRPDGNGDGGVPDDGDVRCARVARENREQRSPLSRVSGTRRRLVASLAFTTLFFAGAAFSAGAGDRVATIVESSDAVPTAEEAAVPPDEQEPVPPAEEQVPSDPIPPEETAQPEPPAELEPPAEPAPGQPASPASDPAAPAGPDPGAPASDGANAGTGAEAPPAGDGKSGTASGGKTRKGGKAAANPASAGTPLLKPYRPKPAWAPAVDPEADLPGSFATVWLHRNLPDPTPPAHRLSPQFAKRLRAAARAERVDWALVLAVLRAEHGRKRWPASEASLRRLASQLRANGARHDAWKAALAYSGRTAFADRALALSRYNRAVGLRALVTGLEAARSALERRILADRRLTIYAGGRADIAAGRIDVRVLVLLRYLAEAHGQVTVSSLKAGHRVFARPGVVSAHTYGLAVDISALEHRPILGNHGPGSVTERAVRNILLLPFELRPQQVISLLGLGGPSFPLADHRDHIHVGY